MRTLISEEKNQLLSIKYFSVTGFVRATNIKLLFINYFGAATSLDISSGAIRMTSKLTYKILDVRIDQVKL